MARWTFADVAYKRGSAAEGAEVTLELARAATVEEWSEDGAGFDCGR